MEGLEAELQFLLEGKSIDEGPIDIKGNGRIYFRRQIKYYYIVTCSYWKHS